MCSGHKMLLIRSSLASLLMTMSLGTHAVIGLCPTPAGPIGIIPCDTACTGSSFINGAMNLNTNYLLYVQTLTRASSTVTQCTVSTSNIEAKTKAKLNSATSSLKTLLKLASAKEITQADGLILKFGSSASAATTTMKAIFLEFIKEIISKTDSFVSLVSLEYKNEVPSSLAPKIIGSYNGGLLETNNRLKAMHEDKIRLNLLEGEYTRVKESTGMAAKAATKLGDVRADKALSIFNVSAEYFNNPAFVPIHTALFSHADLKVATVLARNESNCWVGQGLTNLSHFSCSPHTVNISADDLDEMLKNAQDTQNNALTESFRNVADQTFVQKDNLAGAECLEGLMGMSFEASLVSLENLQKVELLKAFKDYVVKTGCAAMVDLMNSEISKINTMIKDKGAKMSEMTSGLVNIESEVSTEGVFTSEGRITPIMESELGDKLSDKTNKEFNKFFFDEETPLNGKNEIDITEETYLKDGAVNRSIIKNKDLDSKSISDDIDETICQVFGC
jgi:hypothetical protein